MKTIVKQNGAEEVVFEVMNLKEMIDNLQDYIGNETDDEFHLYIEYKDGNTWSSEKETTMNYELGGIAKVIFETPDVQQLYNAQICEESGVWFPV